MNTIASSVRLRLLLPAALIAGSAVLSGSAFEPVIACAAPNDTTPDWDQRFYESCIAMGNQPPWDCCMYAGGDWKRDTDGYVRCVRPPGGAGPAGGGGAGPAGATPAPPPPPAEVVPRPTVPQPSENATVVPPPAAPPTTSTFAPPPLR